MNLLLTLGHHASAVLVSNTGTIINGYEEERLSKVKSDSSYPKLAIERIIHYDPECLTEITDIHISHWFDREEDEQLPESKYFLPKHIEARFPNAKIHSLTSKYTHHDAHAGSVWNFSGTDDGLTVICDGFGTNGETLSIYRKGTLIHRAYTHSLGLLYQKATAHLSYKENQDEYKLLGIEPDISESDAERLWPLIDKTVERYYISLTKKTLPGSYAELVHNNSILAIILFKEVAAEVCNLATGIAYFVQQVLEQTMLRVINKYIQDARMLQFSGGVFYNVKLNNAIINKFDVDRIEFMPLAGDQGAALGMTHVNIDTLCFGKRDLNYTAEHEGLLFIAEGPMEFGPRALGNTSCIADPTEVTVKYINHLNCRPNIMPMAPMISSKLAELYCKNLHRLGRCRHYMIVATDWTGPIDEYRGVLHRKPLSDTYTCRPQVIDNEITHDRGIVINTSLNAHGQPIIYDKEDIEKMERVHASRLY